MQFHQLSIYENTATQNLSSQFSLYTHYIHYKIARKVTPLLSVIFWLIEAFKEMFESVQQNIVQTTFKYFSHENMLPKKYKAYIKKRQLLSPLPLFD